MTVNLANTIIRAKKLQIYFMSVQVPIDEIPKTRNNPFQFHEILHISDLDYDVWMSQSYDMFIAMHWDDI